MLITIMNNHSSLFKVYDLILTQKSYIRKSLYTYYKINRRNEKELFLIFELLIIDVKFKIRNVI